jgi:hypothetical protein
VRLFCSLDEIARTYGSPWRSHPEKENGDTLEPPTTTDNAEVSSTTALLSFPSPSPLLSPRSSLLDLYLNSTLLLRSPSAYFPATTTTNIVIGSQRRQQRKGQVPSSTLLKAKARWRRHRPLRSSSSSQREEVSFLLPHPSSPSHASFVIFLAPGSRSRQPRSTADPQTIFGLPGR